MYLMYLLYTLSLFGFFAFSLPVFLFEAFLHGKYRRGLKQRFGRYPSVGPLAAGSPVWLHAVSVGEVVAAAPLVLLLKSRRPEVKLLVTTVTDAGNQVANEKLSQADAVLYFPLDFPGAVKRALEAVKPRLVLLTETELWPNFLRTCARQRIPVVLINGRLSHRSFRRYRLAKPFFREVLQGIELFCMQSELDAERITALGAPPWRVRVLGNLKFDALASPTDGTGLREEFGLKEDSPLFIAGSTHRGEEEAVLQAFSRVKASFPSLVLILAPRHLERLPEVESLLKGRGFSFVRRTQLAGVKGKGQGAGSVILLDTMGELQQLYALGGVVFVGGSLVPVGGHNILEPARYSRPILFGPHMENLAEVSELFLAQGAAVRVENGEELGLKLLELLGNPNLAMSLGQAASSLVVSSSGAAAKTAALLEAYL